MRHIIKIKIINKIKLLLFRNKLLPTSEIFDNEGINKVAVHEIIHKTAP